MDTSQPNKQQQPHRTTHAYLSIPAIAHAPIVVQPGSATVTLGSNCSHATSSRMMASLCFSKACLSGWAYLCHYLIKSCKCSQRGYPASPLGEPPASSSSCNTSAEPMWTYSVPGQQCTASHLLLYSVTSTTVLRHIYYCTASHLLLYSVACTTVQRHIYYCTASHLLLYSVTSTTVQCHVSYYTA